MGEPAKAERKPDQLAEHAGNVVEDQEQDQCLLVSCKESSRNLSYFLMREQEMMNDVEQAVLRQIQDANVEIATGYRVFHDFVGMMRERNAEQLDSWIEKAKASRLLDLENFATGIERDKAAVAGGLSEIWNNGQLEGHVNRLKLLKRSMYGRANFDLLRLRVLQVP